MKTELVSVVIPAYNASHYLPMCLDSVCRQTHEHLEIIIVNDGSTDGTGVLAKAYAEKDARIVVINQANSGLAAARNTGIRHATAAYVVIIDSDDIMLPAKVEKQLEWLLTHQEYDLTYSNLYIFDDKTKEIFYQVVAETSGNLYSKLLFGNCINPNTVFFRRELFEKWGGFDEGIRSAEDWEFWLRLSYHGVAFSYQPERLTLYRVHTNGLSGDMVTMAETALRVLRKQLVLPQSDGNKMIIGRKVTYWNSRLAFALITRGRIIEARGILSGFWWGRPVYMLATIISPAIIERSYQLLRKIRFVIRNKKVAPLDQSLLALIGGVH